MNYFELFRILRLLIITINYKELLKISVNYKEINITESDEAGVVELNRKPPLRVNNRGFPKI